MIFSLNTRFLGLFLVSLALGMTACRSQVNESGAGLESVEFFVGDPAKGNPAAVSKLQSWIKNSEIDVRFVLNRFGEEATAKLLADKKQAGLEVAGAADFRNTGDAGFTTLAAESDLKIGRNTFGAVEENIVVADREYCWVSFGNWREKNMTDNYSLVLAFHSPDFCYPFYAETGQLARGQIFSDVGEEAFGSFVHEKNKTSRTNQFKVGDLKLKLFFGAQEQPLGVLYNSLMNARASIRFAARALTHNQVNDENDESQNRSHLLNVLEYKNKINTELGGEFDIRGVLSDELVSTTDDCTTDPPDLGVAISIHCRLATLLGANFRIFSPASELDFNVFLLDENEREPALILLSSDFRFIDGFDVTDGVLLEIKPAGPESDLSLFQAAGDLITTIYAAGEEIAGGNP